VSKKLWILFVSVVGLSDLSICLLLTIIGNWNRDKWNDNTTRLRGRDCQYVARIQDKINVLRYVYTTALIVRYHKAGCIIGIVHGIPHRYAVLILLSAILRHYPLRSNPRAIVLQVCPWCIRRKQLITSPFEIWSTSAICV